MEMTGFFHEVKIIHTNRGPKKDGENEEVIFFYAKVATLSWDMDICHWIDEGCFSTIPLRLVEIQSSTGTRIPPIQWRIGRDISQVTTCSIGLRRKIRYGWRKKVRSYGPFDTRLW